MATGQTRPGPMLGAWGLRAQAAHGRHLAPSMPLGLRVRDLGPWGLPVCPAALSPDRQTDAQDRVGLLRALTDQNPHCPELGQRPWPCSVAPKALRSRVGWGRGTQVQGQGELSRVPSPAGSPVHPGSRVSWSLPRHACAPVLRAVRCRELVSGVGWPHTSAALSSAAGAEGLCGHLRGLRFCFYPASSRAAQAGLELATLLPQPSGAGVTGVRLPAWLVLSGIFSQTVGRSPQALLAPPSRGPRTAPLLCPPLPLHPSPALGSMATPSLCDASRAESARGDVTAARKATPAHCPGGGASAGRTATRTRRRRGGA